MKKGHAYGQTGKTPLELTSEYLVEISDLNRHWSMHGGRLFRRMDDLAAQVAFEHSGHPCYTVSGSAFKYFAPVNLEHSLTIHAKITRAWNTSMEIKVQAFRKQPGKTRELVMNMYLYFVAIEEGKPCAVAPVIPKTEEEKREYKLADTRREEVKRFIEKYIEKIGL